jgi:hypothetical protein
MKFLSFLALLVALAFYIVWPGYSGYEIKTALESKDGGRLSAKIDFPSLRASLRPAVAVKVEKLLAEGLRKAGPASGPLTDELKARLMPRIIDGVLAVLVTPETLIRIHADGANLKDAIDAIVAERVNQSDALGGLLSGDPGAGGGSALGKLAEKIGLDPGKALGGLLGKKEAEKPQPTAAKVEKPGPGYSIENIKRFGLNGPLGLALGVAKDPTAREADLTAEMSFIDGDWKLTGLVPRL